MKPPNSSLQIFLGKLLRLFRDWRWRRFKAKNPIDWRLTVIVKDERSLEELLEAGAKVSRIFNNQQIAQNMKRDEIPPYKEKELKNDS